MALGHGLSNSLVIGVAESRLLPKVLLQSLRLFPQSRNRFILPSFRGFCRFRAFGGWSASSFYFVYAFTGYGWCGKVRPSDF
ncbi:uncharacterized protein BDZ99DRAFT_461070 [Mytilinidion resinicola]|uniref:Uncharacterized protein n=1 Tax=Mytilinidion resinicola TaxID=574789 RepID=A0A6A6YUX2_9PEZI|nr:uncharacterized protein BDZ99DRAFT_461070 [Mytilinidion resinicola]KAF2812348.1 hypothetical protein BDZ99DRAFT_461070 [Mytilinidion resinicola]